MGQRDAGDRNHLLGLDGLRGVAALAVFFYHIERFFFVPAAALDHGYLAVDLFFVLSGFVIASAYEPKMNIARSAAGFMALTRAIRLYPLLFLGALGGVLLVATGHMGIQTSPRRFIQQMLFIPAWNGAAQLYPLNNIQWSILFEIVANVAHVIILRRLGTRGLAAICVVALAALCVAAFHYDGLDVGNRVTTLAAGLARVAFSYTAGVLLFRVYRSQDQRPERTALWALPPAAFLICILGFTPRGSTAAAIQDILAVAIVFPAAVWIAARAKLPARAGRAAKITGGISYPLYALQGVAFGFMDFSRQFDTEKRLFAWAAAAAITILGSWIALKWYDEPVRLALSRLAGGGPRPPAQSAP